jgi:hypothetical protein
LKAETPLQTLANFNCPFGGQCLLFTRSITNRYAAFLQRIVESGNAFRVKLLTGLQRVVTSEPAVEIADVGNELVCDEILEFFVGDCRLHLISLRLFFVEYPVTA